MATYPADESAGNKLPAAQFNSAKNVPLIFGNAGETINGVTLPVACMLLLADNEFYACDANDTTKLKFYGFAITNGTDGNEIVIQTTGVVGGFTGLTEGSFYYVQNDKTIGPNEGDYVVLVGRAVSATEILIMRNKPNRGVARTQSSTAFPGTDADVDSITIPGGSMGKNGILKVHAHGNAAHGAGGSFKLALKVDGTEVVDFGTISFTSGGCAWKLDIEITNNNSLSSQLGIAALHLEIDNNKTDHDGTLDMGKWSDAIATGSDFDIVIVGELPSGGSANLYSLWAEIIDFDI